MKRFAQLALAFFFVLSSSVASERESLSLSGRVFDASGEPLLEYEISTDFTWQDGELVSDSPFVIDEEGRYSGRVEVGDAETVVVVYSTDKKFGAVKKLAELNRSGAKIDLEPTVRVRGTVTCEALGQKPDWFNVYWKIHEAYPIGIDSTGGSFDLRLPVGFWEYDLYDNWFSTVEGELPLDGRLSSVNMGKLDLPASYIALNQGKVLEDWNPTAAKKISLKDASLEALRGKWVLVEFWGHQWETCTEESLPELANFYSKHRSDEFEIIALHDNTVKGFVDLDRKLEPIKRRHWKGKDLPFPQLIDGSGEIFHRFEVRALPTTLLINPEGRLYGLGSLELLREALAGRLEMPAPRQE